MRATRTVAFAVATLLVVCCGADPHQEQEGRSGAHNTEERYDINDYRQNEDVDNLLRFLMQYENRMGNLGGIGGSTLLGRSLNNYEFSRLRGGLGGSSLLGRSLFASKNLNGIGGSTLLGQNAEEKTQYGRFVDPLGGGNFVRNLDSLGGGNFVRNLDSLGGANFVKKNLDQIGGPNLVKRNLDSLGGGNLVRNLDSLGGGNFVRQVDPLGGGNFV